MNPRQRRLRRQRRKHRFDPPVLSAAELALKRAQENAARLARRLEAQATRKEAKLVARATRKRSAPERSVADILRVGLSPIKGA